MTRHALHLEQRQQFREHEGLIDRNTKFNVSAVSGTDVGGVAAGGAGRDGGAVGWAKERVVELSDAWTMLP